MSEGGQFPWKRRKHTAKEAPNYQRLLQPLPDPPAGLLWVRNHSSGETPWKLVSTLGDAVAVMAPDNTTSHSYDGTVSAPCVALANEQSMDSDARLYGAVAPEATVVPLASATTNATDSKLPTVENCSNETNEEAEQEVSVLPRASLVPAVPKVAQFPTAEPTSTDCSKNDTIEKKDEDLEKLHPTWGRYGVDYTEHVLLKDVDTLAGLCLRYHIDRRVLQRANRFYGDNLRLAPDRLIIPITDKARQLGWHAQDEQSHAFQMASLLAQFPSLSTTEAQCYLSTNDWDLTKALEEAGEDLAWERAEQERRRRQQEAVKKDRSLKPDPYETPDDGASCCCHFLFLGHRVHPPAVVVPLDGSDVEMVG